MEDKDIKVGDLVQIQLDTVHYRKNDVDIIVKIVGEKYYTSKLVKAYENTYKGWLNNHHLKKIPKLEIYIKLLPDDKT